MNTQSNASTGTAVYRQIPHFYWYIFASFALALAIQLIGLVPPLIMAHIIDVLIPRGDLHAVAMSVVYFVAIPIVMTAAQTYYKYLLALVARRSGRALSLQAFKRLMQQPLSYFDDQNSGELATFIRQDTMKYVMYWLADLPQLAANIIVCAVIGVYVWQDHWLLASLLVLYFPLALLPSNYFGKVVVNMTADISHTNSKMNQFITDTFRSIRFIKAFQLENRQASGLKKLLTKAVGVWGKVAFFDNLTALWITSFVNQLVLGVIFVVAAGLVINGQMTIGSIVVILSYLGVFYSNASTIMNTNYDFKKTQANFQPLADLLSLQTGEKADGETFGQFSQIKFDHVAFIYGTAREAVLKDVSLVIGQGQWVGLMGESGAGKTTIFDLLLRFYAPQRGEILADDTPWAEFSLRFLRQQITLVSQDVSLFPGSLRDNLLLVKPAATDEELTAILEQVRLNDYVRSLPDGLDTAIGEGGSLMSGGQKQRLSLAQGLLRKSPIMLLDEVSSALDEKTADDIKQLVQTLRQQAHLTVLSISHDAKFLTDCDVIYRIHDGQATLQ